MGLLLPWWGGRPSTYLPLDDVERWFVPGAAGDIISLLLLVLVVPAICHGLRLPRTGFLGMIFAILVAGFLLLKFHHPYSPRLTSLVVWGSIVMLAVPLVPIFAAIRRIHPT